jgi:hypothetical protein
MSGKFRVINNSEYYRGLLWHSKSTFRLDPPLNGKSGHSAPTFVHVFAGIYVIFIIWAVTLFATGQKFLNHITIITKFTL